MAELEMNTEGVVTPPVEGQEPPKVENKEPQYTEIEQRALEQGWKPADQWDGDPVDHRTAKEYIDRGELLGKIKAQGAQLREVQQMLSYMSEHNKKVYASGYEKALVDLKQQRVAAMKDNDFEAVATIEDSIDQTKQALTEIHRQPTLKPQPQQNKELADQWISKNSWYNTDSSMKHWANGMAIDYARVNPGVTESEIYEFLTKEVRKEFPHKFKRVAAPNPDGEGNRQTNKETKGGSSDFKALLASLPEDEAQVARNLVKAKVLTEEKYVEDYNNAGRR